MNVVESYIHAFGKHDFAAVPFAPGFTYESPLVKASTGEPRLTGRAAIDFLESLFPLITGAKVHQHIVEGDFCATRFDLETVHGSIPIFDRFQVTNGQLALANPFYDPAPLLQGSKLD